ncbi:MAG TPA: WD40 repeat domain-containing serine/threonine-protein kinase [Gemmataceae bacterium]|jgi:WD40 repeat protein|nr:WD40 repeat domain-containing serine/threonine-protein kinase [Gemmataceae bacterium]
MSADAYQPARQRLGDGEIVREIGRGGMGIVYGARQVSLNRKVALCVREVRRRSKPVVRCWPAPTSRASGSLPMSVPYQRMMPVLVAVFGMSGCRHHHTPLPAPLEFDSFAGHPHTVVCLAFSPDGRALVSGDAEGTIKMWDTARRKERLTLPAQGAWIGSVAFHPGGKIFGTAQGEDEVKLWDAGSGHRIRRFQVDGAAGGVACLAFSPDGRLFAVGCGDGTIRLWNTASGKQIASLVGHERDVECLAFLHRGKLLLSGGYDGMIRAWDTGTHREVRALHGGGLVKGLAVSTDDAVVAFGGGGMRLSTWNLSNGKVPERFDDAICPNAVAISPDGKIVAAVGAGALHPGFIELWSMETRKRLAIWEQETTILCVAFAPDGRTLATAGTLDGVVRLWHLDDKRYLK